MKDMFGTELDVGDIVIYTTGARYSGLNFGVIKSTLSTKKQRYVLDRGMYKPTISTFKGTNSMFKITEDMLPMMYHECLRNIRELQEVKQNGR